MNGAQGAQSLPQGMPQGGNFPPGGPPGGFAGPGGGHMFLGGPFVSIGMTVLLIVTFAVLAVAFWQILRKAGFTPAIALLMLVPVVNLGVALYVAFAEWPVLREVQRAKLLAASAAPSPATASAATAGSAAASASASPAETAAPLSASEGLPQT